MLQQTGPHNSVDDGLTNAAWAFANACNGIGKGSRAARGRLQELWMATVKGNKVVSYHSELADAQDQYRVGVSISRHAGIILEAMKELKSDNIRKLVKDDILKGVLAEANPFPEGALYIGCTSLVP